MMGLWNPKISRHLVATCPVSNIMTGKTLCLTPLQGLLQAVGRSVKVSAENFMDSQFCKSSDLMASCPEGLSCCVMVFLFLRYH